MKKIHLLLLSIFSGLLLSLAWPAYGFPALLFVAFIPLLFLEEQVNAERDKFHGYSVLFYSYVAFFTWNLLTTWWIKNATWFGMSMAVIFNSLFMAIAFHLFHFSRRRLRYREHGYIFLILYWLAYEYLHLDWDLSWSWLNLGNAFANYPQWIQWYEHTGAFGGTLWVLLINVFLYIIISQLISKGIQKKRLYSLVGLTVIILSFPIAYSIYIYNSYQETGDPIEIVVVQPNVDPYTEQYDLPIETVIAKMTQLSSGLVDSMTDFVVFPESALQENIWEDQISGSRSIRMLQEYYSQFPGLRIVVGGSTFKRYKDNEPPSETARWHKSAAFWFDAYNAAIFLEPGSEPGLYHKSKLVPGVERMPFPQYLKVLEKFALDMGGTIGSIGRDEVRKVFIPQGDAPPFGIAICYESAYGAFFARFVKNGANIMLIITNDGWWGNTPGHKQHLAFARMRAIETRRDIARSANTGISCIVNQRGDLLNSTVYWEPDAFKATIRSNNRQTFYVRYGDYIGRIATFASLLMILISIVVPFTIRKSGNLGS